VEILSGREALCSVSAVWSFAEKYVGTKRKDFEEKVMRFIKGFLVGLVCVAILFLILTLCGGCADEVGLRFAPSQAIKANAELTNQLARKINIEGTDPESPASRKIVDGTTASLVYTGRPRRSTIKL